MPNFSTGHLKMTLGKSTDVTGALPVGGLYYQGVIDVYDGTRPVDADDAITTQVLIGRITLNGGAFAEGTGTNGLVFGVPTVAGSGASKVGSLSKPALTLWAMTAGTLSGTKTATWARLRGNAVDAGGLSTVLPRIDMTVSDATGTGELKLSTVTFVTGTEAQVASFSYNQGV